MIFIETSFCKSMQYYGFKNFDENGCVEIRLKVN